MKLSGARKAFTLAELLMAILVISIIMVALAPVITRRAYDNVSIEVNKKKGLEIYTNPGDYTFDVPVGINTLFLQGSAGGGGGSGATYIDKTVSFTTNTTWTVPKGVSQLTFTITGSGGGGAAGNGSSTGKSSCPYPSEEFLAIRGADDESDLCYMRGFIDEKKHCMAYMTPLNPGDTCVTTNCFWRYRSTVDPARISYRGSNTNTSNGGMPGAERTVVVAVSGPMLCQYHKTPCDGHTRGIYRLPSKTELDKVVKFKREWSYNLGAAGLNLCTRDYPNYNTNADPRVAYCDEGGGCNGMGNAWCFGYRVIGQNSYLYFDSFEPINLGSGMYTGYFSEANISNNSGTVKCATPLKRYNNYSGAGGSSGAQLVKTINVLPNDTLTITIGTGGSGASGNGARGSQGGTTQILHKRGSIVMGTYYVKGGLGGNAATINAHGAAYGNGTASNQTTPSGTCYAQFRNTTSAALGAGATSCTTLSYSGTAGTSTQGGSGGRVKNTGTSVSGGIIYVDPNRGANQRNTTEEANKAKGVNATVNGFGGGGGLTPAWAVSSANFYGGGKGASGKIDIQYRIMLPGAGAGSGTRVGGSKTIAGVDTQYEIKYKVTEGSRIVFKIGQGGIGGSIGSDGLNGTATVVGDNDIVFLAGQGAKAVTQTQKNNLSSCIGTSTNSTTIANCINNLNYKPKAGEASSINHNSVYQTNNLGLLIGSSAQSKVSYTIANTNFKANNGKTSNYYSTITTIPLSYGFDGGTGGAPFGIRSNNASASIACSGGMSTTYGTITDSKVYICTSGSPNANNAKGHDPINNEFGGSGGSGAGVIENSLTLGEGSNGSSGYLRIRWDESEQE